MKRTKYSFRRDPWLWVSWSACVLAGLLLGWYLTSFNMTSNGDGDRYWDGVELSAEDYVAPDAVSIADISVISVSDVVSSSDAEDAEQEPVAPKWCLNRSLDDILSMMRSQYDKAYKQNKELYAWIYYPSNTRDVDYINEGLYWSGNSYYLHINSYHSNTGGGQLFIEPKTDPAISKAVLIHGHNMINGSHLGTIKYLTDETEFADNRLIYVYYGVEDKLCIYATFSCLLFPADKYTPQAYMYSDKTELDYIEYVDMIADMSMFKCEYEYTDVISFHTCNRTYHGAHLLLSGYNIGNSYIEYPEQPVSTSNVGEAP